MKDMDAATTRRGAWDVRIWRTADQFLSDHARDMPVFIGKIQRWLPRLCMDPYQTGVPTEHWSEEHPIIFSAHFSEGGRRERGLYTVEPEHGLVTIHYLGVHQGYDAKSIKDGIRERVKEGHTLNAKPLFITTTLERIEAEGAPAHAQEVVPWIWPEDLEALDIPEPCWPAILALDPTRPDLMANLMSLGLGEVTLGRLLEFHTSTKAWLERVYEARLVGSPSAPLASLALRLDEGQVKAKQSLVTRMGPLMVKGGPGTGKSTVLLCAAVEHARQARWNQSGARIGLLTFNTPIRDQHCADARLLAPELLLINQGKNRTSEAGLVISNLDLWLTKPFLRDVFRITGRALEDFRQEQTLSRAMERLGNEQPKLKSGVELFNSQLGLGNILREINGVILGGGFRTLESYQTAKQKGRKRELRLWESELFWEISQRFRAQLSEEKQWTFPTARLRILKALESDPELADKYGFEALYLDEAQDLQPVMIRLYLALVGNDFRRLRLASDPGQCIFGQPLVWSQVDPRFDFRGKTALLSSAHRTGGAIARAAAPLRVDRPDGLEAVPSPSSTWQGERPRLVLLPAKEQLEWLKVWWEDWSSHGYPVRDVAILCRDLPMVKAIQAKLQLNWQDLSGPVRLLTRVRGPEWPVVIIPLLSGAHYPPDDAKNDPLQMSQQGVMDGERTLLYVGMTRATRRLLVLADPECPSELMQYLDQSVWDVSTVG